MTVLSDQTILSRYQDWERADKQGLYTKYALGIKPFVGTQKQACGMSYGLGPCGYDIRIGKIDRRKYYNSKGDLGGDIPSPAQSWKVMPGEFVLLSSMEWMKIPVDICGRVHDKSTLARKGLALQNTILEPGWEGYITLELSNHSSKSVQILVGQPIAQVIFEMLDAPTTRPYEGKYQNQPDHPVDGIFVEDETSGK